MKALCWFRRDLRHDNHAALSAALASGLPVEGVFVFDPALLTPLPREDRRVEFIWFALQELVTTWTRSGRRFHILYGQPEYSIPRLVHQCGITAVYYNRDHDPVALHRDHEVGQYLRKQGCNVYSFKDQTIFEHNEILNSQGRPFAVFTAYRRAWLDRIGASDLRTHPVDLAAPCPTCSDDPPPPSHPGHWVCLPGNGSFPSLSDLGFSATNLTHLPLPLGSRGAQTLLNDFIERMPHYHERRDYPALKGVSYLGAHLRFGTLSVRQFAYHAWSTPGPGAQTTLSELIWRDFYQMILSHRPDLADGHCFLPRFDALCYPGTPADFEIWCSAHTGYPLVDAALRQLHQTGYMHNRLRMITASFLTKDLQVDWRWGEAHFARHLLDFDLAANNGGWQWSASTGCDAQPWFRLFNPVTQSERFDAQGHFIRRYLPELADCPDRWIHAPWRMPASSWAQWCPDYWPPCVDHATARLATLERYRACSPSGEST